MRDRLIELLNKKYDHFCDQCGVNKDSHYTENLADYLLENGVIVPPCKVGDKVWLINGQFDCLQRRFIKFVNEGYVKAIKISMKPMKIKIEYPDVNDSKGRCKGADYSATSIGKTVFLTKVEAEQALSKLQASYGQRKVVADTNVGGK